MKHNFFSSSLFFGVAYFFLPVCFAQAQVSPSPYVHSQLPISDYSVKEQKPRVALPKQTHFDEDCGIFETCSDTKKGLGAHDAIVSLSALGVIPQNKSTNTSIGGHISTTNAVMPEITLTYFFTDNIAISGIAASTRHEIHAVGTALGSVDVGSAWVLPPTITMQWHFLPHERFNPYVGVGGTLAFFHNTSPGGKDGANPIRKLGLDTTVGPAIQLGFDYQIVGDWFLNVDVKQVFLNVTAHVNDFNGNPNYPGVKAHTSLDPTLLGVGIGYRF